MNIEVAVERGALLGVRRAPNRQVRRHGALGRGDHPAAGRGQRDLMDQLVSVCDHRELLAALRGVCSGT